ncbi:MAG: alpha-2-macroglobulin family protein [Oscillospiraceae bacterium]
MAEEKDKNMNEQNEGAQEGEWPVSPEQAEEQPVQSFVQVDPSNEAQPYPPEYAAYPLPEGTAAPGGQPPQSPKKKSKLIVWLIVLVLLIIAAVGGVIGWNLYNDNRSEAIAASFQFDTASYRDEQRIHLRGAPYLSEKQVEEGLTITPEVPFQVTKQQGDTYAIRLLDPPNVAYHFVFTEPYRGQVFTGSVDKIVLEVELEGLNLANHDVTEGFSLTFSNSVTEEALREHLSFEPQVEYYLEVSKNRVYVTPQYTLDYDTDYRLIISAGLESRKEGYELPRNKSFNIHTQKRGFRTILTNPSSIMLHEDAGILLEFDTILEGVEDNAKLEVELYKYSDLLAYRDEVKGLANNFVELEKLSVTEHELPNEQSSITLDNPGLGAYLVRVLAYNPENGDVTEFRKAVAVTKYTVYAQTAGTETLMWLNDSVTGEPLEGYTVEFYKNVDMEPIATGISDADGIAILNYIEEEGYSYYYSGNDEYNKTLSITDADGNVVYVDSTSVLNGYSSAPRDRYYSFFMTDRPIYKPTDEINFWGYVRPYTDTGDRAPTTVRVSFGTYEAPEMQVEDFTLNPDGSFQGSMTLESIKSSHYDLVLSVPTVVEITEEDEDEETSSGEETSESSEEVDSGAATSSEEETAEEDAEEQPATRVEYRTVVREYIQVKDYQKPAFLIESETDKVIYSPGEDVQLTVNPTFYDGTPLPNYDLQLILYKSRWGSSLEPQKLTSDNKGVATASFAANQSDPTEPQDWMPTINAYTVRIDNDGERIVHDGTYLYYPTDTMLFGSLTRRESGNADLSIETARINFDAVQTTEELAEHGLSGGYWGYYGGGQEYADLFRGESVDTEVTVEVVYRYYDKTGAWQKGERTIEVDTKDGVVTVQDVIDVPFNQKRYVYMDVTMYITDSYGRTVRSYAYWDNGMPSKEEETKYSPGFNYVLTNEAGENVLSPYYEYLTYNSAYFGDGEKMHFELYYQDKPAYNNGKILYTIIQDGVVERAITTENTLELTQSVDMANSFNLVAAYFDGTDVFPIRNTVVRFDKESIRLNVEVTPDKEIYNPGDTVKLTVKVTDQKGKGVAGTTCVSIVDESIFALVEQSIDVLSDLYGDLYFYNNNIPKYATGKGDFRHEYGTGEGGGKGDEGALQFIENLRKNFKDTAFFELVRTDQSGNGTISFTLPDNVTSWRVTGAAIGDNLYGGESTTNFITTMPFFLRPVISSKYIEGDDIAILVQGHGVALDENSDITYQANIKGDGVDETRNFTNKAYQSNEINFGKLPEGEYIVTVTGKFGSYTDAVETPLYIVSSNLEMVVGREIDLAQPIDVNAVRYPVTMSFYDKENQAFYSSISSVLGHYCMASNQRMSRVAAKKALAAHMDPGDIPQYVQTTSDDLSNMQNSDGGIGHYIGGDSDLMITLKVLMVAEDQFNKPLMVEYFQRYTSSTEDKTRLAAAHLGLAVLGEENSVAVKGMLNSATATPVQRAYMITALAYMGEEELAAEMYDKYITPNLKKDGDGLYYSTTGVLEGILEEYYYYDTKASQTAATAASWVAAIKLGRQDDADAISLQLDKSGWRYNSLYECMYYVVNFSRTVEPTSLTYTSNGETVTVNLGYNGQKTVSFTRSEFESLKFTNVPDSVTANVYYIGEPEEAGFTPSDKIDITRDIEEVEEGRYRITIKVKFADGAPSGYYDISEWVPSNMRFYQVDRAKYGRWGYNDWWYWYSTEGQKIYFQVYRYTGAKEVTISYMAQRTYEAEAILDSTYIVHGSSGESAMTERIVQ